MVLTSSVNDWTVRANSVRQKHNKIDCIEKKAKEIDRSFRYFSYQNDRSDFGKPVETLKLIRLKGMKALCVSMLL